MEDFYGPEDAYTEGNDVRLELELDEQDEFPIYEDLEFEDHMSDVEADADTLASAGWGTDEDYGMFHDDCDW